MARRKRNLPKNDENDFGIPAFPEIGSEESNPNVDKSGDEMDKDQKVDIAALQAQIAALTTKVEETSRANLALLSTPIKTDVPADTAPQGLNLKDLPDPLVDPEGYTRELNTRIQATIDATLQNRIQQDNGARNRDTQVSGLWDDFSTAHEDYAEDTDRIEFITAKIAKRAKARGMDVERYMFTTRDQFFGDVIKEYDKVFGKPNSDTDEDNLEAQGDDTQANRTAGVFGGMESGGAPAKGGNENKFDMLKEIHEMQKKSGLY